MTNPTIKIVDLSTGEEDVRAMNAKELASFNAIQKEQVKVQEQIAAKEAKKQEVLDKLGLSAEEANILLG